MLENIYLKYRLILISVVVSFFSIGLQAQSLQSIEMLCSDISEANRLIARGAGYDLDEICGTFTQSVQTRQITRAPENIPRNTTSSEEEVSAIVAPYAVSGVSETVPESELRPFGYDLFANVPTTFAPSQSIPVSGEYLLGPGDSLDILFYGKINRSFSLTINTEGYVDFPELGPVGLSGLNYREAKDMLRSRIAAQMIGTEVSISMGSLRSIQIFVLGEAYKPGAYTVSSLSTITNALVASGGVSDIGSLRNIQLKRGDEMITNLDLYDLLLSGDTSGDVRVQSGDVIYIPTVGDVVSVSGQILRPAIYELKGGESVNDLISLAGGMGVKAFPKSSKLERINDEGFLTVLDIDLSESNNMEFLLRAGDHLRIDSITDFKKDIVIVEGAVRHGGEFSWYSGMRISDILSNYDQLNPNADLKFGILIREQKNISDIEVLMIEIEQVLTNKDGASDISLLPRDRVIIFSKYGDRVSQLAPYVDQLRRQSDLSEMPRVVFIGGRVRFPGDYPLIENMSLDEIIELSGGMLNSSYSIETEVSRLNLSGDDEISREVETVNFSNARDFFLRPLDVIEIRSLRAFDIYNTVTLEGEFIFPGTYSIEPGETLTSVIRRAGGFTKDAFINGAVFLRESLLEQEVEEINRLKNRLKDSLNRERLIDVNSGVSTNFEQFELQEEAIDKLTGLAPIGRLVIPLNDIITQSVDDLILEKNDRLLVPKIKQEISVIGEVISPVSYLYDPSLSELNYIKKSGGFKPGADKQGIYIVKASGEIIKSRKNLFRFASSNEALGPGDTIVVPLDADDSRIKGIPLMAEVSKIIYQLSLGAVAINSFSSN